MKIKKITAVYFSATGNTKKVVEALARQLKDNLELPLDIADITLPGAREKGRTFDADDLVVFGTPVYAGRVPNKLLPDLKKMFSGGGAAVIPVVTFGNRSFDDALMELKLLLEAAGFVPVGAAAVPARHAFTDQLAGDRPDIGDFQILSALADAVEVVLKFRKGEGKALRVEGHNPVGPYYVPKGEDGQPAKFLKAVPKTDRKKCDRCMLCAAHCPMGSIDLKDPAVISGVCIKCQACIRDCPQHAKSFDDPAFLSHVAMLEANYTQPAQIKTFV